MVDMSNREMTDFNIENGLEKVGQAIDWEKADRLVQIERERSINWLRNAINN